VIEIALLLREHVENPIDTYNNFRIAEHYEARGYLGSALSFYIKALEYSHTGSSEVFLSDTLIEERILRILVILKPEKRFLRFESQVASRELPSSIYAQTLSGRDCMRIRLYRANEVLLFGFHKPFRTILKSIIKRISGN
jgi:hypothetical protein